MSTALAPIAPDLPASIPDGWEGKAALVDRCQAAGRALLLTIAQVVAAARDDFPDPSSWVEACSRRWGWQRDHVFHLAQVGSALNTLTHGSGSWTTLMSLEFHCVRSVVRLPRHLLPEFCEREPRRQGRPLDQLTREEIRAAVNRWLAAAGEPTDDEASAGDGRADRRRRHAQLDFLDRLFDAARDDSLRDAYVADGGIPARKAAAGGLLLVDVGLAKYEAAESADIGDIEALLEDLDRQRARAQALLGRAGRNLLKA